LSNIRIVAYEWLTGPEFLLWKLAPLASRIPAGVHDKVTDVVSQIPPSANTFVFHLNCTITARFPLMRDELVSVLDAKGIRTLNASVTDVSKRYLQSRCRRLGLGVTAAGPEGDPDQPIVIKTNLNFAGASEWALSDSDRDLLNLGRGSQLLGNTYHYFVVPRREVRDEWWDDDSLICERFIENKSGLWYRVYLCRERLVICRLASRMKIKKVGESSLERSWFVRLVPESTKTGDDHIDKMIQDVATFVRDFRLEFGTIDVVVNDDHRPFIIDVNPTPAYNHPVPDLVEFLGANLK